MFSHSLAIVLLSLASQMNPTQHLQPVGEAKLSYLFWSVYNSKLYTENGQYQSGVYPKALSITYLLDIEQSDLIKSTREQWEVIGVYDQTRSEDWLKQLTDIWPSQIKENDNLTLVVDEQRKSHFYHNDQSVGVIDDAAFGTEFLAIWLSPDTDYPDLRRQLIGQDD